MTGSRLNVHLYRDSFNTPWGFRLQGGKDLNQPLTVQRVFSNSPAEGELQRGDIILSINSRDSAQLTHKQAQDLIKHGGGQVQLVVNRPPPGTHIAPLSPPIVTHPPRAPSLQNPSAYNPPSRPITISMAQQDPSFVPSMGSPYNYYQDQQQPQNRPPHQPLHVHAVPGPQFHLPQRQRSSQSQPPQTPTPTTPTPPWAAQQFAPKRVSKLSKLGGGGQLFGTDFCTLPRRSSSSAHYGGYSQSQRARDFYDGPQEVEPERLATGPIPKVCSLRKLGGGGFDFGSTFGSPSGSATLPRRSTGRRLSQPARMPGSAGFTPTKVTMNRMGGGGFDFGSDYSPRGYGQTPAQRYEPHHSSSDMLNRVQTSLDNITLSPRTPEVQTSSPFYQPYQPQEPYQPQAPAIQTYQAPPPPQQVYTPTGLLLEQQRLQEQQEEGEAIVPVWERRRHFQQPPGQSTTVRAPANKPPPRIPKPRPGPSTYGSFGVDYREPQPRQTAATWRPTPQFKPAPAPAPPAPASTYSPMAVQYSPKPAPPAPPKLSPYGGPELVHATPPTWQRQEEPDTGTPAWRNTLKSTGVKPWEMDVNYSQEQEPVRSVPYNPAPPAKSPIQSGPVSPGGVVGDGTDNGPKVVHMQYNSPLYLYSNENVQETLQGQTQALAGQTNNPPAPKTNDSGERDWSQSAVLKFISQQDSRKKAAPAVPPKPQLSPQPPQHLPQQPPQQHFQPYYDELGASDF